MRKSYTVTEEEIKPKPFFHKRTVHNLKQYNIRFLLIAMIMVALGITEGGLQYLKRNGIIWPHNNYIVVMIVHRIVMCLSLISTIILMKFLLNRPVNKSSKKKWLNELMCDVCGRNKSESYIDVDVLAHSRRIKKKRIIRKIDLIDFLHSGSMAMLFFNSALMVISKIPMKYEDSLQVYLKVFGFSCDLILGLLFTKICVKTYETKMSKKNCSCAEKEIIAENAAPESYETIDEKSANNLAENETSER